MVNSGRAARTHPLQQSGHFFKFTKAPNKATRKLKMKTAILPIFAALSLAVTPAAFASDKFEIDFEYSPVEVSTEYGAGQVYAELEAEIIEECTPNLRPIERLKQQNETRACIEETLNAAVAQMDQPEVTKAHEAKRG
jgi:UrcA family protein